MPLFSLVCVNGVSYTFFLVFARKLPPAEFYGFTAGVAILMIALAISEAGVVYAAPPFLRSLRGRKAARITGGFLALSLAILGAAILLAWIAWNCFADRPLSLRWLVRCSLILIPNLFLQNWVLVRFGRPITLLVTTTFLRLLSLLALEDSAVFDVLLLSGIGISTVLFLRDGTRAGALLAPRLRDLAICVRIIRQFFVLRLCSTIVTACAPLVLGTLTNSAAVAAYLLGDRTKALVASMFQPFVQGLYLWRCRASDRGSKRLVLIVAIGIVLAAAISASVLARNSDILNSLLYGGRHPSAQILALFVIAGHVSVVSALGYFLFLIPNRHTTVFVRAAMGQALLFLALMVSLAPRSPLRNPALAILGAESFLLLAVLSAVIYYARRLPANVEVLVAASAAAESAGTRA